jgi:hypothetical protein
MQKGMFGIAAAGTGMLHKLAVAEATRDYLPAGENAPDFRQGIRATFSQLARGEYNNTRFKIAYPEPKNMLQKAYNVFHATCGVNVFTFRLAYLVGFRLALMELMPRTNFLSEHHAGLFSQPKTLNATDKPEAAPQRKTTL